MQWTHLTWWKTDEEDYRPSGSVTLLLYFGEDDEGYPEYDLGYYGEDEEWHQDSGSYCRRPPIQFAEIESPE